MEPITLLNDINDIGEFLKANFSENHKYGEDQNFEYKIVGPNSMKVFIKDRNNTEHLFTIEYKENKSMCVSYLEESLSFIKKSIIPTLSIIMTKTPFVSYQYEKVKDNNKKIKACAVEWNVENEDKRLIELYNHKSNKTNAFSTTSENKIKIIAISNHRDKKRTKDDIFRDIKFSYETEQDRKLLNDYLFDSTENLAFPSLAYLATKIKSNREFEQVIKNLYKNSQSIINKKTNITRALFDIANESSDFFSSLDELSKANEVLDKDLEENQNLNLVSEISEKTPLNVSSETLEQTIENELNLEEDENLKSDVQVSDVLKTETEADIPNQKLERIVTYELKDSQLADSFSLENTKKIVGYSKRRIDPYIGDDFDKKSKFLFYKINGLEDISEKDNEVGNSLYCFNYNAKNNEERSDKWIGKVSKIELNEETGKTKIYFADSLQNENFIPLERQLSPDNVDDLNLLMIGMKAQRTEKEVPLETSENAKDNALIASPAMGITVSSEKNMVFSDKDNTEQGDVLQSATLSSVENLTALKVLELTASLIESYIQKGESTPQKLIETYQDACDKIFNQNSAVESERSISNIRASDGSQAIVVTGNHNTFYFGSDKVDTQKKTKQIERI